MPNVLRSRDLVSRPDNMDQTVLHTIYHRPKSNGDERWYFRAKTMCLAFNAHVSTENSLKTSLITSFFVFAIITEK